MKELSIEEKAKAYDEAIERVENIKTGKCETTFMFTEGLLEHIFPELKESENEEAIKNIIESLNILISYIEDDASVPDAKAFLIERIEKQIAWLEKRGQTFTKKDIDDAYLKGICDAKQELEKQGEQKPILDVEIPFGAKDSELEEVTYDIPKGCHAEIEDNKVVIKKGEQKSVKVPKFKAGDFIQFNGMGHTRYTIKEVCGLSYYINTCDKRMDMAYTDANFELVEQKPAVWSEEEEVNLQSEIDRVWDNTSNNFLEDGWKEFEDIAKHFFELGLKAQKGE